MSDCVLTIKFLIYPEKFFVSLFYAGELMFSFICGPSPDEHQVILGWEEGFTGQCAGERITMVVPPNLGYGNQASDKVKVLMIVALKLMTMMMMMMILMKIMMMTIRTMSMMVKTE